jgi:hypothetical protein
VLITASHRLPRVSGAACDSNHRPPAQLLKLEDPRRASRSELRSRPFGAVRWDRWPWAGCAAPGDDRHLTLAWRQLRWTRSPSTAWRDEQSVHGPVRLG